MTLASLLSEPDDRLNVMLAEAVGWTQVQRREKCAPDFSTGFKPGIHLIDVIPRYCADLNAVAEVEKDCRENRMDCDQWEAYGKLLAQLHPTATCVEPSTGRPDFHDIASVATIGPKERTAALIFLLSGHLAGRTETPQPATVEPASMRFTEFATRNGAHEHRYKNGPLLRWVPETSCSLEEFKRKCFDADPTPPPASDPVRREAIAPGHNPNRLTVEQVGDGWRLLEVGEETKDGDEWYSVMQCWFDLPIRAIGLKINLNFSAHRRRITPQQTPEDIRLRTDH